MYTLAPSQTHRVQNFVGVWVFSNGTELRVDTCFADRQEALTWAAERGLYPTTQENDFGMTVIRVSPDGVKGPFWTKLHEYHDHTWTSFNPLRVSL